MTVTESQPSMVEVEKQKLIWKMVSDPKFVDEARKGPTEVQQRQLYQKNSLGRAGVPMIPEDLLSGSTDAPVQSKMYSKLSINPLVPLGMAATVGCLIGMCRATLNRDAIKAQYFMRGRCAAQFATVCFLVGGAIYFGRDPRGSNTGVTASSEGLTNKLLNPN